MIEKYKHHNRTLLLISVCLLGLAYVLSIWQTGGGDLMLRVWEAKYFLLRINPYDVFIGDVPRKEGFGTSNAYSWFSYYFGALLSVIDSANGQKAVYAVLDIAVLFVGIRLTEKLCGQSSHQYAPLIIGILLCSVFFWQHVYFLNYNIVAIFGLILVFFGIERDDIRSSVAGMIIIGVKPTLAIPAIICLIMTGRWRILFYSGVVYGITLFAASYWVSTNPIDLVLQLNDTQARETPNHSDGFLFFLKFGLIGDHMAAVGTAICVLVLALFRKQCADPLNGLIVTSVLGISLFYNNVHAWVIAYPIIIIAMVQVRQVSATPLIMVLAFLLVPRLAGQFSPETREIYVAGHNVLRFALLYGASFILVRHHAANASLRKTTTIRGPV